MYLCAALMVRCVHTLSLAGYHGKGRLTVYLLDKKIVEFVKTRTQDCVHISAEFVADLDTRGGTQITTLFLVNRIIACATNLCMHSIIENHSRIASHRRGHRFVRVAKVRVHMTRVIVCGACDYLIQHLPRCWCASRARQSS